MARRSPWWKETAGGAASGGAATRRSAQGREGGRNHQHVLLLQHRTGLASRRRPDPLVAGFLANAVPFGGVLIGPDMAPFVEPAEFAVPGADERRELDAVGD